MGSISSEDDFKILIGPASSRGQVWPRSCTLRAWRSALSSTGGDRVFHIIAWLLGPPISLIVPVLLLSTH